MGGKSNLYFRMVYSQFPKKHKILEGCICKCQNTVYQKDSFVDYKRLYFKKYFFVQNEQNELNEQNDQNDQNELNEQNDQNDQNEQICIKKSRQKKMIYFPFTLFSKWTLKKSKRKIKQAFLQNKKMVHCSLVAALGDDVSSKIISFLDTPVLSLINKYYRLSLDQQKIDLLKVYLDGLRLIRSSSSIKYFTASYKKYMLCPDKPPITYPRANNTPQPLKAPMSQCYALVKKRRCKKNTQRYGLFCHSHVRCTKMYWCGE